MEFSTYLADMARWAGVQSSLSDTALILKLGVIVAVILTASFVLQQVLRVLRRGAENTSSVIDDALLHALGRPLQSLIYFVGLLLLVPVLWGSQMQSFWIEQLAQTGVLLLVGWFLLSLTRNYIELKCVRSEKEGKTFDADLYRAASRIIQMALVVLLGIILLQIYGFSVTGILTFGGVGGLVVGLAAKDLLGNFFGGLMLHMDRPFKTGDWVRSPDRNIEGTVERIGWRQTLIRTHSRNALYIPNGVFLSIAIENPGQMSHRMIREVIGLRYDDIGRIRPILKEVQELLEDATKYDSQMPRLVRFDCFSESSIDFFVQCYTRTVAREQYSMIKQELLLAIAEVVERNGAEMAFPSRTLYIHSQ